MNGFPIDRMVAVGPPRSRSAAGRVAPWGCALLALLVVFAAAGPAAAQGGQEAGGGESGARPGVELGGLLIPGFRAEPEESARRTGFDVLHARLSASGATGLGVRYRVQTGFDPGDRDVSLLDAALTVPVRPELRVTVGQFKAPFSREALTGPAELQFAERAQGPAALAPLRQVGVQLSGDVLDRRLRYRAGAFNGEGRAAGNPDGRMLLAARVEFSRLGGTVQFRDELNVTAGASLAFSGDSARDVSAAGPFRTPLLDATAFRGERLLWGGDLEVDYMGAFAAGEYLRGEYDPNPALSELSGGPTQTAEGLSLEGGYKLWGGLVDLLGRWDAFDPPGGDRREFLVAGANVYPAADARIGFQYSTRLDEGQAPPSGGGGLTSPAPSPLPGGLADGQFVVRLQTSF